MSTKETEIKEPAGMPALFVQAWNQKDAEMLASLFDESAAFINVVGLWWNNRADIQKAHAYGFEKIFPDSDLRLMEHRIRMIGEDAAVVHARMRLKGQSSHDETRTPSIRQNIFTFVLEKSSRGWICISAHNTDIQPGAETNIIDEDGNFKPANYRK